MDDKAQMKALLQAMESPGNVSKPTTLAGDSTQQMKVLLEAINVPKIDEPEDAYANTPEEEVVDSKTQQDMGRDLNKKKAFQSPRKAGDNTKAGRKQLADLEVTESRLTERFRKFKIKEASGYGWTTKRELADHLDDILKGTPINSTVSPAEFNQALNLLVGGEADAAADWLMSQYSDHNGGEMRNAQAVYEDLLDDLQHLLSQRRESII